MNETFSPAEEAVEYKNIKPNFYYKNQRQLLLPKSSQMGKETAVLMMSPSFDATINIINSNYVPWNKFRIKAVSTETMYRERVGQEQIIKNARMEYQKTFKEKNLAAMRFFDNTTVGTVLKEKRSIIYDFGTWNNLFFMYRYKRSLAVMCQQYINFIASKISKSPVMNYENKILYFSYNEWKKAGAMIGIGQDYINNPLSIFLTCLYKYNALLKPIIDLGMDMLIVNEETREFIKLKFTPDILDPSASVSIYTKLKAQLRKMKVFNITEKTSDEASAPVVKDPIKTAKQEAIAKSLVRKFTGNVEPNIFNAESDGMTDDELLKEEQPDGAPEVLTHDSTNPEPSSANKELNEEISNAVDEFFDENPNADEMDPKELEEQVENEVKRKVFVNKFVPTRSNETLKLIEVASGKQEKILSQNMDDLKSKIIDESNFAPAVETTNPNITSSKYVNFDKSYNEKKYKKDLDNAVAALSNADIKMFIEDIKEEDTSDVFNQKKTLTYTIRDENNHVHKLKFDVPIIIDDQYIYMGGSKKIILKQRIFKPIIKFGPDQVQICTMYNKCTVFRHGKAVDAKAAALKKYLTSNIEKFKVTYGNAKVKNVNYKTTLDHDYIASSITSFRIGNKYFVMDVGEVIKKLEENGVDVSKYTEGHMIPVGYTKKGDNITPIDLTSDSFSDLVMEEMGPDERKNIKVSKTGASRFAYAKVKMLNKFIPVILFLLFCEGFSSVMKKCNIHYSLYDTEEDIIKEHGKDYLFKYGTITTKDKIILWAKDPYENQLLLNGANGLPLQDYTMEELESRDTYIDMLPIFYASTNQAQNLDQFKNFLIDPKTKEILTDFNMPTDLIQVFFYACKMLVNNQHASPNSLLNVRIRGNEVISQIAYQCVVSAYGKYRKTAYKKHPSQLNVNPNCVMSALATASLIEDVETMNPVASMDKSHLVTIKASTSAEGITLSGVNKTDGYTMAKRAYDNSMLGIFGISTDHYANNGIIRCLSLEPNITSTNGYLDITPIEDVDELNSAQLFTPTELLTPPGVRHDDPQRTAMMRGQTTHMVLVEDMSPVLIGNKVESVVPYHMHNEFCFVAKNNGKVVDEQNGVYVIQYKDGTYDSFDTNPTVNKNAGDYVGLKFETKLKVGDTFKKDQVIAEDPHAFTKDRDDLSASMNIGVLAKVAVTSIDDILEDSEPMTKKLSERLGYDAIVKKTKALDANAKIEKMAKIGDHVEIGDTLIVYDSHSGDEEIAKFLKEYSKALDEKGMSDALVESNTTALKATESGTIVDIKMYCTVDLEELSPSLKKIVSDYYKRIKQKDAYLSKYQNKNDNKFYKCGQLLTETAEKSEAFYGKVKGEQVGNGVLVEFYISHRDIIKKGDKCTNYSALKGVVSHVIPEGQEPWSEFRPEEEVSAFISPLSILGRKTPSIYTTMFGNKILIELKRKVLKDYFGE